MATSRFAASLSNIYRLGLKELRSLVADKVLLVLIIWAFSGGVYVASTAAVVITGYNNYGAWLLIFCIFAREYSVGVYLLGPGTEVIGSLIVSLWGSGALDVVAALSVVNILLVAVGMGVALRLGVRLHG